MPKVTEVNGLTSKNHLIDTIIRHSVVGASREYCRGLIDQNLEVCREFWVDDKVVGYALIFNFNGIRSFDGYKLIKGHTRQAYLIAKDMVNKYPDAMIACTEDKVLVIKLARILGFVETYRNKNMIRMERQNALVL